MTISTRIRGELFVHGQPPSLETVDASIPSPQLIRLPLTRPPNGSSKKSKKKKTKKAVIKVDSGDTTQRHGLPWTTEEHERFLQGLEQYPSGPWKAVAAFVGTRTPRQTMTHAQKYRQKIQRRRRGLLTSSRQPVPFTSEVYGDLIIATSPEACGPPSGGASKSPTAVDTPLDASGKDRMCPLENDWFDNVLEEELDAAFRAFLESYEPLDEDTHIKVENDRVKDDNSIWL